MKKNKIMVGFFGVYSKEKGNMKNSVKDYEYATNIKGARVANFELSTSTKEIIKDADGKVIEDATDEEIAEKGYTKTEEAVNKDENKTHENYELTKQIIKARLEKMGVKSYVLRLDEETGKLIIELPEDRNTTSYGTEMSFSIEFTSDGAKKLEEISKTYVPAKEEKTEENAEETQSSEEATQTEEKKDKKVSLKLDDTELMSTSFDEPVTTGKMYLTVGQAATTTEDVKSNYIQAQKMSTLLATKPMPLTYQSNSSTFVQGALNESVTNIMLIGVAIIIALAIFVLFARYKFQGLISGICFAGLAALLLLTVRYWNVVLSKEGIVAIFAVLVLNFGLVYKILDNLRKEKDNKKVETKHVINMAIKDFTLKVIPVFIFAVIFAFGAWEAASSFGMVMFWGLALIELYNLFITKSFLK